MRLNPLVMAGLVPAIHVFVALPRSKEVDAGDKRGHDELVARSARTPRYLLR
jgi:hypothetical protein